MDTVDKEKKEADSHETKPVASIEKDKTEDQINGEEDESQSRCFLPPRKGGISRKSEKTMRKVQWNDLNGKKLVEVLEYEPSEASDSDNEDTDTCICTMM